jgi:TolA-binding protein
MSSRFLNAAGLAAVVAMLALSVQTSSAQITFPWERDRAPQGYPQGQPQSDDADAEMRIQRLEQQLRQLTGQNEELQYRNRQLEERLRQLGAAPTASGGQPQAAQPAVAAAPPPVQAGPAAEPQQGYPQQGGYRQPQAQPQAYPQAYPQAQPGYSQPQIASPAPIAQEAAAPAAGGRRRGDAFDPSQNPNAPGAPRALGGGQMPI